MTGSIDLPQRQSIRQRQPTIPYDERIPQSSKPSKPSKPPKASTKPFKLNQKASTSKAKTSDDDAIQLLCNKAKVLDIQARQIEDVKDSQSKQEDNIDSIVDKKAMKKAKAEEVARLGKLPFEDIVNMISNTTEVIFEPFSSSRPRDAKVNIPSNIDAANPLALLDLFIPPKMYTIIAENTNLYAIANNASIASTSTNRRYWWPTNANEVRVFYSIFYYMGVHREPNYHIYWETLRIARPCHTIRTCITLARFESLRRYLHVSNPAQLPLEPRSEEEEEKLPTETLEKLW
jgi:hypothetical protein